MHIITINILRGDHRIDLHNLVHGRSEPARKEIEEFFRLVKAQSGKKDKEVSFSASGARRAVYGKTETKSVFQGPGQQFKSGIQYKKKRPSRKNTMGIH